MKPVLFVVALSLITLSSASADDRNTVLRDAAELRQAGDLAGAEKRLRDFVDSHPQDSAMALSLGDLIAHSGRSDAAIAVWTAMLQRVSPRPDHFVNVARRLQRLGRQQQAIETLLDGVKATGNERPFLWDLAQLHMEVGNQQEAVRLHLQLITLEPYRLLQITGSLDVRAETAADDNSASDGLGAYIIALRAAFVEAEPATTLLLAHALLLSGKPDQAFSALTLLRWGDLGQHREVVTDGLIRFAQRGEQLGHPQIVSRTYELLTRWTGDPRYATTSLQRRAQMQARQGNTVAAIATYRQLLSTIERPSDVAIHELELAELLLSTGHAAECRQMLEPLSSSKYLSQPQRARVLEMLATSGWQLDDLEQMREALDRLVMLPEGVGAAALGFTELAILQGDFEMARQFADSLATHYPESAQTNDALTWLLLLDEHIDTPEALQAYAVGRHRILQGRQQEAAQLWQKLDEEAVPTLAHRLRLEAAGTLEGIDPAAALALYDEILNADALTDRMRFTATLANARLLSTTGKVDVAIRNLEALLLQLPLDPRSPIALDELQQLQQRDEG